MTWNDEELALANSLHQVLQTTITMLKRLRSDGITIHHVAGPITTDGDANINRNLARLLKWRTKLSTKLGAKAFVFTAPVIFNESMYVRLGTFNKEPVQREVEFQEFWDKLIKAEVIDEIHFAPGWEKSAGALHEHQTAAAHHITVNYLGKT